MSAPTGSLGGARTAVAWLAGRHFPAPRPLTEARRSGFWFSVKTTHPERWQPRGLPRPESVVAVGSSKKVSTWLVRYVLCSLRWHMLEVLLAAIALAVVAWGSGGEILCIGGRRRLGGAGIYMTRNRACSAVGNLLDALVGCVPGGRWSAVSAALARPAPAIVRQGDSRPNGRRYSPGRRARECARCCGGERRRAKCASPAGLFFRPNRLLHPQHGEVVKNEAGALVSPLPGA
jgi:hypothetical protein